MLVEVRWEGGCIAPAFHELVVDDSGELSYRVGGSDERDVVVRLGRLESAELVHTLSELVDAEIPSWASNTAQAREMTIQLRCRQRVKVDGIRAAAIEDFLLGVVRRGAVAEADESDGGRRMEARLARGICAYCAREALHEVRDLSGVILSCRACGAAFINGMPPQLVRGGERNLAAVSSWPLALPEQPWLPDGIRTHIYLTEDLYAVDIYDGESLAVTIEAEIRVLTRIQRWLGKAKVINTPPAAVRAYLIELTRRSHSRECDAECLCRDESGSLPAQQLSASKLEELAAVVRRRHPQALTGGGRLMGTVTKYGDIEDYQLYESAGDQSSDGRRIWSVRCAHGANPTVTFHDALMWESEDTEPG